MDKKQIIAIIRVQENRALIMSELADETTSSDKIIMIHRAAWAEMSDLCQALDIETVRQEARRLDSN